MSENKLAEIMSAAAKKRVGPRSSLLERLSRPPGRVFTQPPLKPEPERAIPKIKGHGMLLEAAHEVGLPEYAFPELEQYVFERKDGIIVDKSRERSAYALVMYLQDRPNLQYRINFMDVLRRVDIGLHELEKDRREQIISEKLY